MERISENDRVDRRRAEIVLLQSAKLKAPLSGVNRGKLLCRELGSLTQRFSAHEKARSGEVT